MNFNLTFFNRDFSSKPQHPFSLAVRKLSWSAFGGCDQAFLSGQVPVDRLVEFTSLLRCPVTVSDPFSLPVWWGFVDRIDIIFEKSNYSITLEDLFNRVAVFYSFLSPDNRLADRASTPFAGDLFSISEYGTREVMLPRDNISDDFALQLRDTFLALHSRPRAFLGINQDYEDPHIEVHCSGWFSTLNWKYYQNLDGYYANHGPGPGQAAFGDGTTSNLAQMFTPTASMQINYAWFMLRKFGSPASNIRAMLWSDSGGQPNAILVNSLPLVGSTLSQYNYAWYKFTFPYPYSLTPGSAYWVGLVPYSSNASNYYIARIDENMNYKQVDHFALRYTTSWGFLPAVTVLNARPVLYFRAVCTKDSGQVILDMANHSNQFFTHISGISSGVITTPYRDNGLSTLAEITNLMKLGTANLRPILADVTPERRLRFYEQPSRDEPAAFLDRHGRFFTRSAQVLPAYRPPIGQWAVLSGLDRSVSYFEGHRAPAYFVDRAEFTPGPVRPKRTARI